MSTTVRIAAAADIHCAEPLRGRIAHAFEVVADQADLVLLAGDLTTHGNPEQAAVLADACRGLSIPVVAVLGNHDYHENRCDEVIAVLSEAGIRVLQRESAVFEVGELEVGIVGAKGFVGGFPGAELPDFGEPLLREVYAETTREVEAIEEPGAGSKRGRPRDRQGFRALRALSLGRGPNGHGRGLEPDSVRLKTSHLDL